MILSVKKRRFLASGILVSATVLLFALLTARSVHKERAIEREWAKSPAGKQILANLTNWNRGLFIPISTVDKMRGPVLKRLSTLSGFGDLSALQQDELIESICHLFIAYHSSTPDDFLQFRIPNSARIVPNTYQIDQARTSLYRSMIPTLKELQDAATQKGVSMTNASQIYNLSDPLFVLTTYRQLLDSESRDPRNPATRCVTCWNAINFDTLTVKIAEATASNGVISAETQAADQPNIGFLDASPSVTFHPAPAEIIARDGKLLYATIRVNIQIERSGRGIPAYPASVLWYWCPEMNAWLPNELVLLVDHVNGTDIFF